MVRLDVYDRATRDFPPRRGCGRGSTARSFFAIVVVIGAVIGAVGTTVLWKSAGASPQVPATSRPLGTNVLPPDRRISGAAPQTRAPPTPAPLPPPVPPPTAPPEPPVPPPQTVPSEPPALALASPSAVAGGEATLRGRGCPINVPVIVTIDGREVGRSVASGVGEFETRLDLRDVEVGRRVVLARCGSTTLKTTLDVVVNTTLPAAGPAAIASMVTLFGLIGLVLLLIRDADQPVRSSGDQEGPGE